MSPDMFIQSVGETNQLYSPEDIDQFLGSNIEDFKPGDRVAATNHGSGYAEYSVAPGKTTYRIPDGTSFEGKAIFETRN
jgi:NADPH:quinone reductase-like Zn-dependent oxidoreductase